MVFAISADIRNPVDCETTQSGPAIGQVEVELPAMPGRETQYSTLMPQQIAECETSRL